MKKQQANYKVNLIGEQDLSKLSADELELLVSAYIEDLRKHLSMDNEQKNKSGVQ